ncbi:hypothetical protein [Vibrio metschnikovii]|uniref:hypothetical protein n=1 Tax=Vibrio metschnikovii TaxID=28172 RepID=UPI001C2F55CB|nr:hypothetical protein [Vibrio metschnikovii]
MSIQFLRDFVCVYFWCQYVDNYNFCGNKKIGLFWPFLMTSSLICIFIHGIYMFVHTIFDAHGQLYFWAPYTISWLLAAYITYIICIKNVGFKQGEAYFTPIEKSARCSAARYFNFVFIFACFSSRLLYLLMGAFGVFRA